MDKWVTRIPNVVFYWINEIRKSLKLEINQPNIGIFRGLGGFSLISASAKITRCAIMDRNQLAETNGGFGDKAENWRWDWIREAAGKSKSRDVCRGILSLRFRDRHEK